ncbi:PAS domain S-box protein [Candidatus Peregrinibacteria bacterium]|jgi:PAS domain S-box-containing protein|nr:PAS domain S-box protein [Candidatus Peregrinibacteria bacterium]MBT4148375.1 PAS domain S-box protein [Candidatus Peregrinibacteria bacterium]MBT4366002.1 PAS domain S-box protein [Candidatus Peregrinibacteria bacterium]MBT4456627.1 PAS domain S-box protein [Candidatus Peregrinibacteria bacterium]
MNPKGLKSEKKTQLELLNHVYKTLSEQETFHDILIAFSKIIKDQLKCQYLDFVFINKDKNSPSVSQYRMEDGKTITEKTSEPKGLTGKSIATKKTIKIEDVSKSTEYHRCRKDIISELCIPIFFKKAAIGCINLEFIKKQEFDTDTITILEIIGKAIGPFLRNAKLHEEVEKSEYRFRQLVENMNEGLWVGDENHNTTYVNPKFAEMAGLTQEECTEIDCFGFYDEESAQNIHEQHKARKEWKSSQYELTMISKDGKRIPLLCSGTPIPGGTVGIFTDLSQLKETEKQIKELSKSEKLLAHISNTSIDGIVSLDRNLIIQTWNLGAEKMFGYDKEESINQNVKILMPPDKLKKGELEHLVKMILEKGFLKNFETTRIKKDGKEISVAISATKLTDEKNRFMGFGIMYRDITYQKKAEKELQARFESMQNAYLELGTQRRQLDYLLETLNITVGDEQFPNIENYIINAAMMLTKANGATLRLYDEEDNHLHLKTVSGVSPEWWGKSKIPYNGSVAERAYQQRQPLFIDDIQNNPSYTSPRLASEHNFKSCLLLPLYVKSKYIGNMSLYSSSRNSLHLLDNSFISNFGKQASLALLTRKIKTK